MALTTLSTVAAAILERENKDKEYIFSVAGFANTREYVNLRIGEGEVDVLLALDSTSIVTLKVPRGMAVYAWASAGTPKIAIHKL